MASDCAQQFTLRAGSGVISTEVNAMELVGRQGAWRYFVASRVNIGLGRRRKVEGKVRHALGCESYSPLLHTSAWTVEENARLGEEASGPGLSGEYVCFAGCTLVNGSAKLAPSACSAC